MARTSPQRPVKNATGRGARPAEKSRASRELKAIAYHEAGHAVACCLMRRRFKYVAIEPTEGAQGQVGGHHMSLGSRPGTGSTNKSHSAAERMIVCLLAGHIAERAACKKRRPRGSEADFRAALDLAVRLMGSIEQAEAYLHSLYARTRQLIELQCNWRAVEALANVLLDRKRVGYRKARRIVAAAVGS